MLHFDPYDMWVKRSPRQVLELLHSYNELNKDVEEGKPSGIVKEGHEGVKIPDFYKDKMKPGTKVFDIEKITRGDI